MNQKKHLPYLQVLSKLLIASLFIFLFSSMAYSQKISGRVTDADGKSLPDISVTVKGKNVGTTTNASGQFSIAAASNEVLVFSSVGYTMQEVTVSGKNNLAVSLIADAQNLDR